MSFARSDGTPPVDRHHEAVVRAAAAADLIQHAIEGELPLLQAVAAAHHLLDEAGAWEAWPALPPEELR